MSESELLAAPRRATIVTLSRVAGVAPSTISRALKGDPRISSETRARIARLAKELGYTPHASARTLSSGRSGLIGIVVGASANPFYTELLHEAARQVAPRGMRLLVIHAGAGPVEDSTAHALLQYQVDGCLMTSVELPSHVAEICRANGVPVVMVNRRPRMHSSAVTADNIAGAAELAELLLARGHRRFALMRTSASSSTGEERHRGFAQRLAAAGIEPPLLFDGRSTYEGGFEAGRALAALPVAERPGAVFSVSDIMAMGLLDALRLAGIAVPGEVAVVGFDGLPQAAWPIYDLTTVEQPLPAMIGRALDLLQARIAGAVAPDETIALRGRLILRGSSG
ncbi:LacI family DNA-binding transcriptional regulator [Pseudoroseomonas globiformis]|uniref:LacI family DNA-binding transcriptional regulator n=1 Tax=Teichococcus globiformis TaxID=2307229 RepID=A0ABV7FTS5_9PROT